MGSWKKNKINQAELEKAKLDKIDKEVNKMSKSQKVTPAKKAGGEL